MPPVMALAAFGVSWPPASGGRIAGAIWRALAHCPANCRLAGSPLDRCYVNRGSERVSSAVRVVGWQADERRNETIVLHDADDDDDDLGARLWVGLDVVVVVPASSPSAQIKP